MIYISEEESAGLISHDLAYAAGREALVAAASGQSGVFPAVLDRSRDPGNSHVVSMGCDAPGKHELPVALLQRASLFCDLPSQSVQIGDFQHAREAIEAGRLELTQIGDVIEGRTPGRLSDEEITVYDSSGIALQDLCIAEALIREKAKSARG